MSTRLARVTFSGVARAKQKQPVHTLIRQREYAHDTVVVTLDLPDAKTRAKYRAGLAMNLVWGWSPDDLNSFYGYVHHTQQVDTKDKRRQLKVVCIGASYRMKDARQRSFKKLRAYQVAARIAREHHFSLVLSLDSRYVWPILTQAGRSDWDFLVWLAKKVGYTMYCTRTNITFAKRAIDTKANRLRPTFLYRPSRWYQRNAVYSLTHRIGTDIPGSEKRIMMAWGISDDGRVIRTSQDGSVTDPSGTVAQPSAVFTNQLMRPVSTAAAAAQELQAEADMRRFAIVGKAKLSGNSKVHQGSTIQIGGIDGESNGLWYVTAVDHVIDLTGYTMDVDIARDALGDSTTATDTSDSGKPILLTDCDVSVEDGQLEIPDTISNPVDDCVPVEAVDYALPGPQPVLVPTASSSPARRAILTAKPLPSRPRGKTAAQWAANPRFATTTKLTVWRAAKTTVSQR